VVSFIQKLLIALFPPKVAEDMETESRSWILRCPTCGHERSIWDVGGIRWGAKGNPKRLLRCPACGNRTWHTIYRKHK
jgi:DNA-directed RNA polymerase subunit RPC12/RpoP